jgi:uncharacterized RDD family membrane protein YckC
MSEGLHNAPLLLRVMAKAIDLIAVAAAEAVIPAAGIFAAMAYILISDGLFDGRSAGKKIIGLKVISINTGGKGGFRDSIIRNAPFLAAILLFYLVPFVGWLFSALIIIFEFLLILGNTEGMRLGDNLAGTRVVEG